MKSELSSSQLLKLSLMLSLFSFNLMFLFFYFLSVNISASSFFFWLNKLELNDSVFDSVSFLLNASKTLLSHVR